MLTLLKIQNLALVDSLVWQPQSGFMTISGETGAGKSVIMGAISLVLGERTDKSKIRSGESQCILEAVFSLSRAKALNDLLEDAGVAPCEEGQLLIRRQMGLVSNKQFINNCPVTLQLLRQVGAGLVDMHHPDEHRSLTSPQRQLTLLDAFSENDGLLLSYQKAYKIYTQARAAYEDLLQSERASVRELEFLRHQIEEIEAAAFTQEECDGLEARWQRSRHTERLSQSVSSMLQLLEGDEYSVLIRLRQLVRQSQDMERIDASVSTWTGGLGEAVDSLQDFSAQLQDYYDALEGDPAERDLLEARISLFDSLKRKYGADFAAIEAHYQDCQQKWQALEKRDESLALLQAKQEEALAALLICAQALSASRKKVAGRLQEAFLFHARQLGFHQSLFEVHFIPLDSPSPSGAEEVEFLFGPNPGEPLKPLRMIASSGELARVMLALKSALAKQDDTPLLVFDEIDANVGGEIARAVGMKMLELGQDHQVIAITHFPQVAALAHHHYLISKSMEQGRSVSRLQEVEGQQRVEELVRMLGMSGPNAYAHAKDLLLDAPPSQECED